MKSADMDEDSFGEIINSSDTFAAISFYLKTAGSVFIGWTDGGGTHHDILFTELGVLAGNVGGGLGRKHIMVSIMRVGAFGFNPNTSDYIHPSYIEEKLNVHGTTALRVAELLNGVFQYYRK